MSQRMYIMPDGRPLRTYLSEVEVAKSQFTARRRRKNGSDDTGWRSGLGREVSEEEQAQIDAGMKAGRARRRRYFNDKLLRDMAGALTHADMQELFKPVPFGEQPHITPLERAVLLPFWESFRSIEMDKQKRVLEAWEARSQEAHSRAPLGKGSRGAAPAALTAWSRIDRRARHALKRARFATVHAMEVNLQHQISEAEREVVLDVADAFERLLAHGIAQYHGLRSRTMVGSDGHPRLTITQGTRNQAHVLSEPEISCADVLLALESMPHGGLTPASLHAFLFSDHDNDGQPHAYQSTQLS